MKDVQLFSDKSNIQPMTKIIHTADLHLQQPNDQRWQALEAILQLAQQQQADAVTISGDLFDHNFEADQARAELRTLFEGNGFPIIIIPGNHDNQAFRQGLFFGQEAVILNQLQPSYSLTDQLVVWGLEFLDLSQEQLLTKLQHLSQQTKPNQTNVLLFHGELLDQFFNAADFGEEGSQRYMPVKLSYFSQLNFDYVLAGHFHRTSTIHSYPLKTNQSKQKLNSKKSKKTDGQDSRHGFFVYPGSPVSITKKEIGPRHVTLIDLDKSEPQLLPLKTPFYHSLKIVLNPTTTNSPLEILEEKLAEIPKQAKPLISITGFFDSQRLNVTEQKLAETINHWNQNHEQSEVEFSARDISHLTQQEIYQAVNQLLASQPDLQKKADQINQTLLTAMMKLGVKE